MPRKAKSAASKARQKKQSNFDYKNKVKQKESESMGQQSLLSKCCEPPYVNKEDRSHGMLYSEAVELNGSADPLPALCEAKKRLPTTSVRSEMTDVPQDKITEKHDTIQIPNATDWSNLPTVSFLPSESRMADVNQSDCMYGDAAGRQCMPTCYLAIAKLKLERSCNNWSGNTVKELITWGSRMYQKFKPIGHDLFSVDDLPRNFTYNGQNFEQAHVQVVAGIIDSPLYTLTENCTYVMSNITDLFQGVNISGALFTMNGYTTAILKAGSQYWVVDTHSRDRQGRPNSNGNAGMFRYLDVVTLARYLVNMAALLSNLSQAHLYVQYEIARFDFVLSTESTETNSITKSQEMNVTTTLPMNTKVSNSVLSSSCVVATPLSIKLEAKAHNDLCSELLVNAIEIGSPNIMQKVNHIETVSDQQLRKNTKLTTTTELKK